MAKKKNTKAKALRCPTCGVLVSVGDAEAPFCSERCRTIDLGKWASGAYRISSPILDPEVLEGLDERVRGAGGFGDSSSAKDHDEDA